MLKILIFLSNLPSAAICFGIIYTVMAISSSAWGAEGFSQDITKLDTPIQKAWTSTFAVISDSGTKYKVGSAVLVGKTKVAAGFRLYFLSSAHVFIDPTCELKKICLKTKLFQTLRMPWSIEAIERAQDLSDGHMFHEIALEAVDTARDVILVSVLLKVDDLSLDPIRISKTCNFASEDLFSVGFPAVMDRMASSRPIDDKDLVTKRWSQGVFVDWYKSPRDPKFLLSGVTNDVLSGSSGGPLVNSAGELVGLIQMGASTQANANSYTGSEVVNRLNWQGLATDCDEVKKFLQISKNRFGK